MAKIVPISERPRPLLLTAGLALILAGLASLVYGLSMDVILGTGLEYYDEEELEVVNIDLMRRQLLFVVSGWTSDPQRNLPR